MEALVDQRLGEIDRAHPAFETAVREDRLVHARAALGERSVEHVLEAAEDVIGVEHGILGDLLQPIGTVAEDIGERAGEHARLPMKGDHPPKGIGMLLDRILLLDEMEASVGHLCDERQWSERCERFR